MKVALLSYAFSEYCVEQANALARDCDVLLLLPRQDAEEYASRLDSAVRCEFFDKPRLRQPIMQVAAAARIVRQIHKFRPDVVHFQHGHMWFNLALPWLRSYPLVITVHDPRHHVGDAASRNTPQALMDFGFRRADRIIVHGDILKRQVVEALSIAADKIHVIPHIALGCIDHSARAYQDSNRVLFFGRIWKYKGLEHLIRAQPLITAAVPDAKIIIAGEGDDFEPYRRLMDRPDRFIVHNRYISPPERDNLFRQASIVVLPYIEATQSGVVPLAYAFAKPVVATNTGALSEVVEDGITGRVVPPANHSALAAAIIELLRNPALRHSMGAAAQRKLEIECAPQVIAPQTMTVYRRAIQDRAERRQAAFSSWPSTDHSRRATATDLFPPPDTRQLTPDT